MPERRKDSVTAQRDVPVALLATCLVARVAAWACPARWCTGDEVTSSMIDFCFDAILLKCVSCAFILQRVPTDVSPVF